MAGASKRAATEAYSKMPKSQLKKLCRDRGLLVGGNMDTLVNRLVAYSSGNGSAGAAPAAKRSKKSNSNASSTSSKSKKPSSSDKRLSGASKAPVAINPFEMLLGSSMAAAPPPMRKNKSAAPTRAPVPSLPASKGATKYSSTKRSSGSTPQSKKTATRPSVKPPTPKPQRKVPVSKPTPVSPSFDPKQPIPTPDPVPPKSRPKPARMSMFQVERALKHLGIKAGSRCVMAGIGRGFIDIRPGTDFKSPQIANQVIYKGPCSCGSTLELKIRLKQALAQSDWGGDGDEECAILAARCLCSNYLSGMCTGNPHFTTGKHHNHCVDCDGYGVCLGDYRYTHCARCNTHPWRGNCDCTSRQLGEVVTSPKSPVRQRGWSSSDQRSKQVSPGSSTNTMPVLSTAIGSSGRRS